MQDEHDFRTKFLNRARGAHGSVYLTLISIVQGAILGYLLSFVDAHRNIGTIGWLLASITFIIVVLTWNEYVMGVITFDWVPDLLDSFIPFSLGISQYLLVNTIRDNPTNWFFAQAVFSAVTFTAFLNMYVKARRDRGHNTAILHALGIFVRFSIIYPIIYCIASFIFACTLKLTGAPKILCVTFLCVFSLGVLGYLVRTWLYWRRLVKFARRP